VERRTFDFEDNTTYDDALEGVKTIFLVRPPAITDVKKTIFPLIDVAKKRGVKAIVFLSLLGAEKNKLVPHHKIENYIISSNIPYAFLRASFFMQNLNTTHAEEIKYSNSINVPAGNGKTSFIDVRDIAQAAAKLLSQEDFKSAAYDLTGSEALSYFQVAQIFSKALGRRIEFKNPSIINFYRTMRKQGLAREFILVMIAIYTTARIGLANRITNDVELLLKRKPITLEHYVNDYKLNWF
jgi:uncharacterized protein YbjT (DUF2867 family)